MHDPTCPPLGVDKLNANCGAIQPSATLLGALGRTQATMSSHYDITDDITFVTSAFFTRRSSEQRIRPEPLIGSSIATTYLPTGVPVYAGFQVPTLAAFGFTDPMHLFSAADPQANVGNCGGDVLAGGTAQCFFANLTPNQFGERDYKQISDTYRIRVGLEGHLFTDFNWEAGYVGQRNEFQNHTYNSGNFNHLAQASGNLPCIDVPGGCTSTPSSYVDALTGQTVSFNYSTPLNPINFFNLSTVTPQQWAYLKTTLSDSAFSSENYIYADINGPLFDLPFGTVQGSLGVERRFENAATFPDSLAQEGYSASQTSPTAGGYGVSSVYGELRVPVLKDLPFAESLVFTPSARFDHYSTFGDATTYKLGADWQVIDLLRFRGSYNTGFRAPNINELYGGSGTSFLNISGDPCDSRAVGFGGNTNAGLGSLAPGSTCYKALAAIGLNAAQIADRRLSVAGKQYQERPAALYRGRQSGPVLRKSRIPWTIGAVVTPDFIPGLALNGDYYDITITQLGAEQRPSPRTGQHRHLHQSVLRAAKGGFVPRHQPQRRGHLPNPEPEYQFRHRWPTHRCGSGTHLQHRGCGRGLAAGHPGFGDLRRTGDHQITNSLDLAALDTVSSFTGTYNGTIGYIQPKWKATLFADYHLEAWTFHYDAQYIGGTNDGSDATGLGVILPRAGLSQHQREL